VIFFGLNRRETEASEFGSAHPLPCLHFLRQHPVVLSPAMAVGGKEKLRIEGADQAGQAIILHGTRTAFDVIRLFRLCQFAHTRTVFEQMKQRRIFVNIQE
jgi:hypothetical protein